MLMGEAFQSRLLAFRRMSIVYEMVKSNIKKRYQYSGRTCVIGIGVVVGDEAVLHCPKPWRLVKTIAQNNRL